MKLICAMRRAWSLIVEYSSAQSTESPSRRHSALKAFSSSAVRARHRSMKFLRDTLRGGAFWPPSPAGSVFSPGS